MELTKKVVAEFIGTFWLVLGGCGSAVLAAGFMSGPPNNIHMGIGFTGVALAFGLTLLTMVYTIGPISGCLYQPGRFFRPVGRQSLSGQAIGSLSCRPGCRGDCGFLHTLFNCQWKTGIRSGCQWLCRQRLWRAFPWWVLPFCCPGGGNCPDLLIPAGHSRFHRHQGPGRLCWSGHWPGPYPDSPGRYPGDQRFG